MSTHLDDWIRFYLMANQARAENKPTQAAALMALAVAIRNGSDEALAPLCLGFLEGEKFRFLNLDIWRESPTEEIQK
jgi:hypothetical protein